MLKTLVLLLLLISTGVIAQESKKHEFQEWAYFPAIAYNAETGTLLGGLAVQFFEPDNSHERTSSIDYLLTATENEQYSFFMAPNFYLKNNSYHIEGMFEVKEWVANYYGVGNNTDDTAEVYNSSDLESKLITEVEIMSSFYLGGMLHYKKEDLVPEAGGDLETLGVTGFDGGVQTGLGVVLTYDTRDNTNDARKGSHIKYTYLNYLDTLGSDFEYYLNEIKFYKYLTVNDHHGLVVGGYVRSARGEIPFRSLSSPDGIRVLRGIENGRYRDRDLVSLQTEYRFPIYPRWGSVVFLDLAQVAHDVSDIRSDEWKTSIGAGLRWAINPQEKLNLRLDVSYVDENIGLVLEIRDAF